MRSFTFRIFVDIEFDFLTFFKRPVPVALNGREVNENLFGFSCGGYRLVTFDEAVSFGIIKPLYTSDCHVALGFPGSGPGSPVQSSLGFGRTPCPTVSLIV